jgi:hypothetical protein
MYEQMPGQRRSRVVFYLVYLCAGGAFFKHNYVAVVKTIDYDNNKEVLQLCICANGRNAIDINFINLAADCLKSPE